ncbi:M28 family metallopeptidase [Streptomyces calidiresistens]|uniref:M28 family peptidase n=1 Tax=Streptomyces calidiresistens TaxID=1485586 RepID=A0A7W3T1M6_9ACTN|nr:M28 family peptidase [Streptomyces calidiresistens]MBB0229264.1 M28 family peptidase [Streptomyces calidiresistens]
MKRPQRRLRGSLAAVATAAIAAPLLLAGPASATVPTAEAAPTHAKPGKPGKPDRAEQKGEQLARTLVRNTTGKGAMRHLVEFQRIADAHNGNRAAGTPGYDASAAYAARVLERAGYDVTLQYFPFLYRETVTERLVQLSPEEREIEVRLMSHTANSPAGGTTAELVEAPAVEGTGAGCTPESFAGDDFEGRIALIQRGACPFADKQANAAAAGAVGAIVYNNVEGALNGTLGEPGAGLVPTGGISLADGEALSAALSAGETVVVDFEVEEFAEERMTPNVLAETPGGDPSNVIMVGAHLDSVLEGPGINDNASGSAGVLETAVQLAKATKQTGKGASPHAGPNKVRFALWSAEELGLLGAHHYVDELTEEERDSIALYLNFDMIASPNYGLFVYDGDGSEGLSAPGPEGSAQIEHLINGFMEDKGWNPRPTAFSGRSDYGPFIEVGIPAGGTFTGAEGIKTEAQAELWGGVAGVAYDPCYHTPCDDLSNIDATALDINVKVIAYATARYSWSTASLDRPVPPGPQADPETADSGGLHGHHGHGHEDAA